MNELSLTYDTYLNDLCEAHFAREFVQRGLGYCRTARWRTGVDRFDAVSLGDVVTLQEDASSQTALVVVDDSISLVLLNEGFVQVRMATPKPGSRSWSSTFTGSFPLRSTSRSRRSTFASGAPTSMDGPSRPAGPSRCRTGSRSSTTTPSRQSIR